MRKIIHVDMDCFFAAVEVRDNPALQGKPVAVGGSASGRGVISTCSYEARKFGVRSAMATATALKLCPQLILLKHRGHAYREASEIVHDIFHRHTDLVQSLSLDEAYLDVTDADLPRGSATLLAERIRAEIFEATRLTASAGIAPNKQLAKLASEARKPNGQFTVAPGQELAFLRNLSLGKLHGIGPVTAGRLKEDGLVTCADVWRLPLSELIGRYGSLGEWLHDASRGIDDREVVTEWERKSLSVETTFPRDLSEPDEMRLQLDELMAEMLEDLQEYPEKTVKGLQVKIKYHDFRQTTVERAGVPLTADSAWTLFQSRWLADPRAVRLLGVGVRFATAEEEGPQLRFDSLDPAG